MSTEVKTTVAPDLYNNFDTADTAVRSRKPIVLSSHCFNNIVNNATLSDRAKALAEAEEQRINKEKLKLGSNELAAQFKGNVQRTQEQKLQQMKEQRNKKLEQGVANYRQAKENENQKRQEKLARAEQIIERLKPGPRELRSAVHQSEVLRARNEQRKINEEFEKAVIKQENEAKIMCNEQALNWIEEDQQRLKERHINTIAYKNELLLTINQNQANRLEQKKQNIREQQVAREAIDIETKVQIEKERSMMDKKREALRKNALEAMKMVEQRRLSSSSTPGLTPSKVHRELMKETAGDRMVENVEAGLRCVYNDGKSQLNLQLAEQSQKLADEQQRKIDTEVHKFKTLQQNSEILESERIRRDITTMQLKFTAEEQEKVRKDKAAKQARIEAYLKEMQQQKEMQLAIEEEKRFEISQRLKNSEVNCLYAEQQAARKLKQFQKVRAQLNQQVEDKKKHHMPHKTTDISCEYRTNDDDHKYFFEYARNLMEDGQRKGRPVYPFVKAIYNYKHEHQIDCERKVAKHLQSNIFIGENDAKNANCENMTKKKERNSTSEIVKSESNAQNIKAEADSEYRENGKFASNIQNQNESRKFRYSMDELKKLNRFAPSCH